MVSVCTGREAACLKLPNKAGAARWSETRPGLSGCPERLEDVRLSAATDTDMREDTNADRLWPMDLPELPLEALAPSGVCN